MNMIWKQKLPCQKLKCHSANFQCEIFKKYNPIILWNDSTELAYQNYEKGMIERTENTD